ncbi:MAG TPA: ribonuclease III [Caldisericia bacterium]|nr:ribonuclease III [Caldisericia bacterium]
MEKIPYIENLELLKQAMTHRSFLSENHLPLTMSNERLEFLGDAILEFWISQELYLRYPMMDEGELSQMRTQLVNSTVLAEIAHEIGLGKYLIISKNEENHAGRSSEKLLANAFESLLAALYLDQDYKAVNAWLLAIFETNIQKVAQEKQFKDPKTLLQELVQKHYSELPVYRLLSEEGLEHDKSFCVAVQIKGKQVSKGKGKTKQKAEMEASKKALQTLEKRFMQNDDKPPNDQE